MKQDFLFDSSLTRREFLEKTFFGVAGGVAGVSRVSFGDSVEVAGEKRNICLTIDDGPLNYMDKILNLLGEEEKNPVIFYMVGRNLESKNGKILAKLAVMNGHIIGNHSYSHPFFQEISFFTQKQEIEKTDKIISEIYNDLSIPRSVKLFRFPYGGKTSYAEEHLKSLGYKPSQFWNVDSQDWMFYSSKYRKSLDTIIANCKKAKEGDIVLVHEKEITLKTLIPFYLNSGNYNLKLIY
jgi:peptidoglycan/xylan/chitin deacetylase (PgdA/CDA1 family)